MEALAAKVVAIARTSDGNVVGLAFQNGDHLAVPAAWLEAELGAVAMGQLLACTMTFDDWARSRRYHYPTAEARDRSMAMGKQADLKKLIRDARDTVNQANKKIVWDNETKGLLNSAEQKLGQATDLMHEALHEAARTGKVE